MKGKIYFVRAPGRIKVGFTRQPERRMAQLRSSDMEPLEVLGITDGTRADERGLHDHLGAHRLRGEWFSDNDAVRASMAEFITGKLKFEQDEPPAEPESFIDRHHNNRMLVVNTTLAEVRFLNEEIALRMSRKECAADLIWFAKYLVDRVLGPLLNVPEDNRLDSMCHDHGFDPPR